MLQTRDGKDSGSNLRYLSGGSGLNDGGLYSSALLRWQIVIARNFEDGDMVFSPVPFRRPGFFVTLPREGLHLRARNPIAEAQRSLLNCWMVNGYKFRWNMAFCSRIIIDTAWGHLIFSVFSAFRVFTFQEKPRTEKLKNWIPQEKNGPQTSPMEFSFSVFQFSHCWCLKFNRNKIGANILKKITVNISKIEVCIGFFGGYHIFIYIYIYIYVKKIYIYICIIYICNIYIYICIIYIYIYV